MNKTLHEHLIESESAAFLQEAADWKAAVKLCTDLLERAGCVTPEYYQAILKAREELGPYFVLAPGIALPHASPDSGVLKDGFALVTLKKPVVFGDPDNDPVDILLALAASDGKAHNEGALVQAVTLLDDEATVGRLRKIKSMGGLEKLFDQIKIQEEG